MRIKLDNVAKSYSYPLVQLRGSLVCYNEQLHRPSQIKVMMASSWDTSKTIVVWPIVKDRFCVLVHLVEEVNRIKLWIEAEEELIGKVVDSVDVCLGYKPTVLDTLKSLVVRLVYVTCADSFNRTRLFDNGKFEAPEDEDGSVESAIKRISLGALMSQCFFAQSLTDEATQTYQLEMDPSTGLPFVHQFTLNQSESDLWSHSPEELWKCTASQLMNSPLADRRCKYLAFIGFSRYQPNTSEPEWIPASHVRGYVSLGGGGLALLSSHCLYTWPETVKEIAYRLTDDRPVDKSHFMDDSQNRNTRSGCFATTLGASIHELAHTFNLGHSESGIMERAFNQMDAFFLPLDKPTINWWTTSESTILQHHKWLNAQSSHRPSPFKTNSHFTIDHHSHQVHSKYSLVVAEYRRLASNQVIHQNVWPTDSRTRCIQMNLPPAPCDNVHTECLLLFLMDCKGNILQEHLQSGNSLSDCE